jgi:hypothetical protein
MLNVVVTVDVTVLFQMLNATVPVKSPLIPNLNVTANNID